MLLQLSEYNVKVKKHMQAMDALSDLERFTLQVRRAALGAGADDAGRHCHS